MKIKGFWKSLWELNKQSLNWLKDYWLLYTILAVLVTVFSAGASLVYLLGWNNAKSIFFKDKTTAEDEEFLK